MKGCYSLINIVFPEDARGVAGHLRRYMRYKLKSQWEFVYFELSLDEPIFSLKLKEPFVVRLAVQDDIPRIESDIYPLLSSKEEGDRRYISLIGKNGVRCFVAEKDDKLVHYSWVFDNVLDSPLMHTPFYKTKIRSGDIYLGPVFTSPHVRGAWISPYSLSKICEYLKSKTDAKRILLLVHTSTPGAVGFYKRLGFREITNACPVGPVDAIMIIIKRLMKC
jgi:GNAT superfamily N-acetyltransferase